MHWYLVLLACVNQPVCGVVHLHNSRALSMNFLAEGFHGKEVFGETNHIKTQQGIAPQRSYTYIYIHIYIYIIYIYIYQVL